MVRTIKKYRIITLLLYIIVIFSVCCSCSNIRDNSTLNSSYSFSEFIGKGGTIDFPLFPRGGTAESFRAEHGMSIDEYKALSAEALDNDTGGYTSIDTITIEGVPVYAIPGFDAETGYVDRVSIVFLDDGRDISQWELLTEAFKQCFGGFEGDSSEVIAADGKTRLDFEYSPIAGGDSYRLGYIFIQYL